MNGNDCWCKNLSLLRTWILIDRLQELQLGEQTVIYTYIYIYICISATALVYVCFLIKHRINVLVQNLAQSSQCTAVL
jgi:hypothetical protein